MNLNIIAFFLLIHKSRIIGSIDSRELLRMSKKIELPYNQRVCDDMKVKEILDYQKNYYKTRSL